MVGHRPAAHRGRPGGTDAPKGGILRRVGRQYRHIPRGGVVVLVVQPIGIGKGGARHAKSRRLVVHGGHKSLQPAAAIRQRQGRVVAAAQHQAVQQLLHRHHLAGLEIHGGALHHVIIGHRDGVRQPGMLQHHQGRHDLGGACDPHTPPGVLFIQHFPAVGVHQDGRRGGELRRLRPAGQKRQQHAKGQHRPAQSFPHDITPDIILCGSGLSLASEYFLS